MHLVVQPPQPVAQLLAYLGIQRAERLVEQQHRRLDRQRPGQRHPLALAAGELRGQPVGELLQVDQSEQLVDPGTDLRLRPVPDLQSERDVAPHRQVLERRVVLEDEADVALLRRQVGGVDVLDLDPAGVGLLEAGDDAQEGRLATAGGAEQGRELPGRDAEGDVVERDEVAESLADTADLDAQRGSFGRIRLTMTTAAIADEREQQRGGVGTTLVEVEVLLLHGQGGGPGLAVDVAGDDLHGAELAERPGEAEHDAVDRRPT